MNDDTAGRLRPCGTVAAYVRHLRHREVPCDACVGANATAKREWTAKARSGDGPTTPVTGHGTDGGYRQHLMRTETPCEGCREAHNAYCRDYYHTTKQQTRTAAA